MNRTDEEGTRHEEEAGRLREKSARIAFLREQCRRTREPRINEEETLIPLVKEIRKQCVYMLGRWRDRRERDRQWHTEASEQYELVSLFLCTMQATGYTKESMLYHWNLLFPEGRSQPMVQWNEECELPLWVRRQEVGMLLFDVDKGFHDAPTGRVSMRVPLGEGEAIVDEPPPAPPNRFIQWLERFFG